MRKTTSFRGAGLAAVCVPISLLIGGCADLVVTDVHHASWVTQSRIVKTTVKNDGSAAAAPSTTRLEVKRVSSPAFVEVANRSTPGLGPGEQVELDIWPYPPTEFPPSGQCIEVRSCADSANVVNEGLEEGNNCLTRSFCTP